VYAHFRKEGRVFPWRTTRDPYRILVAEVMLQQTQAPRVVEKYELFIRMFPNVRALARAPLPKLLRVWQGLGYNRRAIALKRAAEVIVKEHRGKVPRTYGDLVALPAIGPYTARAILAFAYDMPAPFIETNIRTVYIHFFFPKKKKVTDKELMPLIEETMDRRHPREWYNALMDYGVMLKRKENASARSAHYKRQSPFKGSHRELRGRILAFMLKKKKVRAAAFVRYFPDRRAHEALSELAKEGFLRRRSGSISLA
ncbi:A/G-specific adenine glycosylase, partial [Candidatus Parcubacteria bacterium]|nr:A/G-specific adenine glycosylase [Candidatus Parcubacteria bacterium]